jgi:hypothetical protein
MKKAIAILSVLTLITSSCGQITTKQEKTVNNEKITQTSDSIVEPQNDKKVPFDYRTLPIEWAELSYTGEDGKYVVCGGNESALRIEDNKFVYWSNRYDILRSYQIDDTIVINVKLSKPSGEYERVFKFFWFDKNKGVAQWTANDESLGDSGLFVINPSCTLSCSKC